MKYITVAQAAKALEVSIQAVYQAMWRKSLKCIIKDGRRYTTPDWLKDYHDDLYSKQVHSTYNGTKVFDSSKGEYSVRMIAERFNVYPQLINWHIARGRIKAFKKGAYHVILEDEIANIEELLLTYKKESARAI